MKLGDGNNIYFRTLDLNVPFEKIKQQLETFTNETFCKKNNTHGKVLS